MAVSGRSRRRSIGLWTAFVIVGLGVLVRVVGAFVAVGTGRDGPTTIPDATVVPRLGSGTGVLVEFLGWSGVRLRDGRFVSETGEDVSALRTILAEYPGTTIERLFLRSEADVAAENAAATASGERPPPDLNLYYRLVLPQGVDPYAVIAELRKVPVVAAAYPDRFIVPHG